MRFAVAFLICALAVANAQYNRFNNGFANQGQYNNQYNRFQQPYNRFNNQPKPFVSTTPFPVRLPVAKAVANVFYNPNPVPVAPVVTAAKVVASPVVVAAKVASDARSAETLRYGNEINPDGSYNYFFETNNGIAAQAQGTPRNFGGNPPVVPDVAQGSFSWVSPEGKTISVTYVADENGYQPQSDALPVAPALPAQIARAFDYIARNSKN